MCSARRGAAPRARGSAIGVRRVVGRPYGTRRASSAGLALSPRSPRRHGIIQRIEVVNKVANKVVNKAANKVVNEVVNEVLNENSD